MVFKTPETFESSQNFVFHKVLLPTDFSRYSIRTLECGVELAKIGVKEVILFHVGTYDPYVLSLAKVDFDEFVEKLKKDGHEKLDKAAKILENVIRVKKLSYVSSKDPADEILKVAYSVQADLILMGSRGHGWLRGKLLGSVSESVVRRSNIPVLLVKYKIEEREGEYHCHKDFVRVFEKVMFATDTSPTNPNLMVFLKRVKEVGSIYLVHIVEGMRGMWHVREAGVEETSMEIQKANDSLKSLKSEIGGGEIRITIGNPVKEILKIAEEEGISLITIGATGKDGYKDRDGKELGRTADSILRHSNVPVLVFR